MTEPRKVKTLKDTNYFVPGTYKYDWRDYMVNVGIANILTRCVLAPVERWRIVKQTQVAYPLRPLRFSSVFDYLSSNLSLIKGSPRSKAFPLSGEVTQLESGSTSPRPSSSSASTIT